MIEHEAPAPPAPARPTRVAVIPLGMGDEGDVRAESTLGVDLVPSDFAVAADRLAAAGVDVVIINVNCGGGLESSVPDFHGVLTRRFAARMRTVAWVHTAVFNGALTLLPVKERVFAPNGQYGWGTDWPVRRRKHVEGLPQVLADASRAGGLDPAIAMALRYQLPLSVGRDPATGAWVWFQDEGSGEFCLNTDGHVFTIGAKDAVRFGLAAGEAATRDDVVRVLGLGEVEWAGEDAAAMLRARAVERSANAEAAGQAVAHYLRLRQTWLPDGKRGEWRFGKVEEARALLPRIEGMVLPNPGLCETLGVDAAWVEAERRALGIVAEEDAGVRPVRSTP